MRAEKRKRLEAKGWKVGTPQELLDLSDEEAAFIELRLKMEAGDPTVSLDLLVKSLLALGASNRELARIISQR